MSGKWVPSTWETEEDVERDLIQFSWNFEEEEYDDATEENQTYFTNKSNDKKPTKDHEAFTLDSDNRSKPSSNDDNGSCSVGSNWRDFCPMGGSNEAWTKCSDGNYRCPGWSNWRAFRTTRALNEAWTKSSGNDRSGRCPGRSNWRDFCTRGGLNESWTKSSGNDRSGRCPGRSNWRDFCTRGGLNESKTATQRNRKYRWACSS